MYAPFHCLNIVADSSGQQDVYYGCPREIFSLTSLRRLNLSFQGLVHLSPEIEKLTNLEELNLSNNPLLESLPGSVSKLQSLSGMLFCQIMKATI